MRSALALVIAAGSAAAIAIACSDDPRVEPSLDAGPDASEPIDAGGPDVEADVPVVPKGARVVGVATDVASFDFVADVQLALDAGARTTNLRFAWDEIERPFDAGADASDDAGDADGGSQLALFQPALHIANLVYEGFGSQVVLAVDAVDGSGPRAPVDLQSRAIDDAELGARFDKLTDYALDQIRDTKLTAFLVASAVDVPLGDDVAKHAAFTTFFTRAAAHARTVKPGLVVGFGVTAEGLVARKDRLAGALAAADVVAVSYLGADAAGTAKRPSDVAADIDRIVAAAPAGKPVFLHEAGFPSATAAGSDEATQAVLVTALFRAWDRHAERIPVLSFRELDDATATATAALARREGRSDAPFAAVVGSLGLRDSTRRRKPSFGVFVGELRARGF